MNYRKTVGEVTKEDLVKWRHELEKPQRVQRRNETKKRIELLKLKINKHETVFKHINRH